MFEVIARGNGSKLEVETQVRLEEEDLKELGSSHMCSRR